MTPCTKGILLLLAEYIEENAPDLAAREYVWLTEAHDLVARAHVSITGRTNG